VTSVVAPEVCKAAPALRRPTAVRWAFHAPFLEGFWGARTCRSLRLPPVRCSLVLHATRIGRTAVIHLWQKAETWGRDVNSKPKAETRELGLFSFLLSPLPVRSCLAALCCHVSTTGPATGEPHRPLLPRAGGLQPCARGRRRHLVGGRRLAGTCPDGTEGGDPPSPCPC